MDGEVSAFDSLNALEHWVCIWMDPKIAGGYSGVLTRCVKTQKKSSGQHWADLCRYPPYRSGAPRFFAIASQGSGAPARRRVSIQRLQQRRSYGRLWFYEETWLAF